MRCPGGGAAVSARALTWRGVHRSRVGWGWATLLVFHVAVTCWTKSARSEEPAASDRLQQIRAALADVDTRAIPPDERAAAREALTADIDRRLHEANRTSTDAWRAILNGQESSYRKDWQSFRDQRIDALRNSLGRWPKEKTPLDVHSSGTLAGDGFVIDKLVYQTRPGLWASANLYRPAPADQPAADKSRPAMILVHSHHNPKSEGELQTMGMTWARQGAFVLVPDLLGHGERRQHPFAADADWPTPFKRSRQDYYFRYDVNAHLELIGETLMGWLAWDLMRGLDLLLTYPEVDPERTIILGSVAGGGDVAAVTAALDPRFAAACVFNFGGPQPETRFPLPENPEDRFGYAGSGSWESTRNLRDSACGGFLPWVIVGGIAPRRLIYAHEFSWDQEHDPVWKRLGTIYAFYDAPANLAFTHGSGSVKGQPPESTHCNNIGAVHRRMIYPALARWFGMPEKVEEYTKTRPAAELLCWTDALRAELKPKLVRELCAERATRQPKRVSDSPRAPDPTTCKSGRTSAPTATWGDSQAAGPIRIERAVVSLGDEVPVPLILFLPMASKQVPLVVGIADKGKAQLLSERLDFVTQLLASGVAVGLVDVRGTGETAPAGGRDRTSHATSLSSSMQMLGPELSGGQVVDFLAAIGAIARRKDIDASRIALWGDSLAKTNAPDANLVVPHAVDDQPGQAEPMASFVALMTMVFVNRTDKPQLAERAGLIGSIQAIYLQRGLTAYAGVFDLPRFYLPHDAITRDWAYSGDMAGIAAFLAPLPLRMANPVDAGNRPLGTDALQAAWRHVRSAYEDRGAGATLVLTGDDDPATAADWLIEQLAPPEPAK